MNASWKQKKTIEKLFITFEECFGVALRRIEEASEPEETVLGLVLTGTIEEDGAVGGSGCNAWECPGWIVIDIERFPFWGAFWSEKDSYKIENSVKSSK